MLKYNRRNSKNIPIKHSCKSDNIVLILVLLSGSYVFLKMNGEGILTLKKYALVAHY